MIKADNIHKSYKNHHVLKGLNLSCEPGKIQALLGANGAGKTSLVHILSDMLKMDRGTYFIDQEEISDKSYAYRRKVGYVFEEPMYIEKYTIREYLEFVARMHKIPKEERQSRIEELIEFLDLEDSTKKLIEDYSKGMKSKVSLAAALIHKPSYLILDEPFDGIDFLSIQKIGKVFRSMADNGTTILLTSHQYDVISEMCDSFALLKEGAIQFNVSMKELREMSKAYSGPNPVKSYLEELMLNPKSKKNLSFIQAE